MVNGRTMKKTRKKKNMHRFTGVCALFLAMMLILSGCTGQAVSEAPVDTEPETVTVTEAETTETAEETGAEATDETEEITEDGVDPGADDPVEAIDEDGSYTTKEDVALYLYTYGHLPDNFITKKEAGKLGWSGGSLEDYAPGKCIGGSYFGNYEGLLPEKDGREYHECDIDTLGASKRGAKRIVYSNDGLIYYTEDHYESFELLYGTP